jgi:hypothetical protein
LDLKKLLASSMRQRILVELSVHREMRVMQLVHGVSGPYNEVNRNLGILKTEDIIIDICEKPVRHGVVRVIRLNRENPRTLMLLEALKVLGKDKNHKTLN